MRKFVIAAMVAVTTLAVGMVVMPAGANPEPKVIVCKYVANENAPSGEVFGQVIDVSANALDGFDPNLPFPQTFTDDQGSSVAVRFAEGPDDHGDEVTDCDQEPPVTSTVPPPPPPPCEDENGRPIECPTTSVPPPPPPPTTATHTTPPPACKGSVALGPWYGDPRINITLTGAGTFVVSGGVQRFSNTTTFTETLACGEVLKIGRYKIKNGHYLTITQDGVQVTHITPPAV